ncbi:MAG: helix-turn-helix domain-containing protein, partial [Rubrivivax sp.]|nr:helix-turn-helix domain-containing protein [Rubrivivax sp.]
EAKDLPAELLDAGASAGSATPAAVAATDTSGHAAGMAAAASVPLRSPAPEGSAAPVPAPPPGWLADLRRDARKRLDAHEAEVWESLTQQFEATLIQTALEITRGRRIEAAQRLGIGRNTITRKIQELGLPD